MRERGGGGGFSGKCGRKGARGGDEPIHVMELYLRKSN